MPTSTVPASPVPAATVLVAPDRCTKYLVDAVDHTLSHMDHGAVLEIPCDPFDQIDLAEWCLNAGKKLLNPFDGTSPLLVENTPVA